jgi:hypothetical protein
MRQVTFGVTAVMLGSVLVLHMPITAAPQAAATQTIDLAAQLKAGKLRAVNREMTPSTARPDAIHLSEKEGNGVAWVGGTDFALGTIEVDIKGRDLQGRSFVGIAFHRKDDNSYDCVYLRPFNFRATDPARKQHAVQYIALPDYDWPRLRKEFPEEFENPVDASLEPTGWTPLKVVVNAKNIQIFAGAVKEPTLEVRRLGTNESGAVGLWAGNGADGDYANLRITPAK